MNINIKEIRLQQKLTQQQLASLSGISTRKIIMLENGITKYPNLKTLQVIAQALNVKVSDLVIEQ